MSTIHIPLEKCNTPESQGPGLVSGAYANAFSMAQAAVSSASTLFNALATLHIPDVQVEGLSWSPANLPPLVAEPPAQVEKAVVGAITERKIGDTEVAPYDIDEPPDFSGTPPALSFPEAPDPSLPTAPVDTVVLQPVVLPTAPVIALPELPELLAITLPEVPDISFAEFTAVAPGAESIVVNQPEFSWSEPGYSSELLDAVTARLLEMLQGGTGIPEHIWLQIIDRARDEQQMGFNKAERQVREEWALRGFTLPAGVMLQRIDEARRQSEDLLSKFIRDNAIERAKLEIENMRFAVERSISLETMLIGHYDTVMNRSLEAAKQTVLLAIEVINARIATFQANWAVFKIQADVYRELVQAELSKIQLYQAQVQAQGLIAQINTQIIEAYKARVDFYESVARIYTEQVRGAVAVADLNTQQVSLFAQRVQAYTAQIQSYNAIYGAWQTRIQAEATKMGAYQAEAQAYAARIQGYSAYAGSKDAQHRFLLDRAQLQVTKFAAELEQEKTKLASSSSSGQLQQDFNNTLVQLQQVTNAGKQLELERAVEEEKIDIENERIKQRNYEFKLDAQIKQLQFGVQIIAENLRTAGQVYSQLAASAMSSVNMGASVSQSAQTSSSCSKSQSVEYLGNS